MDHIVFTLQTHITKAIEKRIDAFDQWCLRRILNITWSERVTNLEVRMRTGQPLLSDTVWTRRLSGLKLFFHVARADKSQDYSCALQACISPAPRNWRRRPGRPRHSWLRTVEEDLRQFNLGLASGLRRAQNRTTWRTLTGTATTTTSSDCKHTIPVCTGTDARVNLHEFVCSEERETVRDRQLSTVHHHRLDANHSTHHHHHHRRHSRHGSSTTLGQMAQGGVVAISCSPEPAVCRHVSSSTSAVAATG